MSENNLPQTVNDADVIIKKQTAWGKFGVASYKNELKLQAQSQQIINSIIIPKKYEDIARAEESVKEAAKLRIALIEERKKTTDTIDGYKKRLMEPEKSIEEPIAKATAAIIKLKQQKENEDRKAKLKSDEAKLLIEKITLYIADMNAALLQGHAKLISDSYEHALKTVEPKDIKPYIEKIKKRITIVNQVILHPKLTAAYHTAQEVDEIIQNNFVHPAPAAYVDSFAADIDAKYFDYELAWNNKEQALKLNAEELEENKTAIEKEKNSNAVAARLQNLTTPVQTSDTKPLKRVFKINMAETLRNAYLINTAYLSNIELCEPHLRIKDENGFNLSIKQMIAALEKVKNDDNNFNFTNIIFQEAVKL